MKKRARRCSGIDVHKEKVMVCVLPPKGAEGTRIDREFSTYTADLVQLRVWLQRLGVTDVAMESTGMYWRPVWNILEGYFRLLLANPAQVKALLGRKSDRRDARRLAEFLEDGRLDPSFVPPREIRTLRQLTRDRVGLVEEQTRLHNQIRDLLETANIKLGNVASDILGETGRRILVALASGQRDAERLSWKGLGKLRKKEGLLRKACTGRFTDDDEFRLKELLTRFEFGEQRIGVLEAEIRKKVEPYQRQVELLDGIPGVNEVVAWTLIAELGADMTVFPTPAHCSSWAGLCPGENESAGKKKSTRTRKGNRYVRRALVQAGWAASREKGTYFKGVFRRLVGRRGMAKAVVAVAHKLLQVAYVILRDLVPYRELGEHHCDVRQKAQMVARLRERLEALGHVVTLAPAVVEVVAGVAAGGAGGVPACPQVKRKRGRPPKRRQGE